MTNSNRVTQFFPWGISKTFRLSLNQKTYIHEYQDLELSYEPLQQFMSNLTIPINKCFYAL